MRKFEKLIINQQFRLNSVRIIADLAVFLTIVLLCLVIYLLVFIPGNNHLKFFYDLGWFLKIIILVLAAYSVYHTCTNWIRKNHAARYLDIRNQDLNDTFQNALELQRSSEGNDRKILELIFRQADATAAGQQPSWDFSPLRRIILPFLLISLGTAAFLLAASGHHRAGWDMLTAVKIPPPQHKESVELEPGNLNVIRNTRVEINVLNPEIDVEHSFFYRLSDTWREEKMAGFSRVFPNLDFSFDYYIATPFAVSDTFRIEVFEKPAILNLDVVYNYPAYTGLGTRIENNSSGNLKAIINTEVILMMAANNPIQDAQIIFSDGSFQNLEREGRSAFRTQFQIKNSLNYHINLTDILANKSDKITRTITALPDRAPEVSIIYPGRDTLLNQNMLLPLKITASDDFGLQNLNLKYYINTGETSLIPLRERIRENIFNLDYSFDLNNVFLIPGDRVTYWVEVSDNSPESQTSLSRKYLARFPSIEEIYQEIEREEKANQELLQNTLDSSRELQEEFDEKRRELMKKDEFDWQDKKSLEEFLNKQEDLNQNIQQVAEEYQNLLEKFDNNQALARETLDKMEKIRELMDEIANEDLLEAMQKMQQSLENMDPDVLRKAMEDFKFSLEDFTSKLDQTIQLLEQVKKEQALQKALEIAEEMQELQEDLNKRTEEGNTSPEQLAAEQQKIAEKLASLEEQLQKTLEMLDQENENQIRQGLQDLQQELQQNELEQDLQQSMENLQNNQMSQAQQNQQSALNKMQKMTKQLSSLQQMMASGAMAEMGEIIARTISRLLIFSREHERSSASYQKDPYRILSEQIALYESLNLALTQLYSVPMIVLALGPKFIYDANFTIATYREMFQYINDAQSVGLKTFLSNILKGYNLMIFDLMQAQSGMQQGGQSGSLQSLMQALQQMGQQQMMINLLTQEILQQLQQMGQDGRMSRDMMAEAQRLAREEERLAENLRRLLQTDPEAQKQTSALNRIIEDLETISRNLQRGKIDQETVDLQERILSRLLDAQKSVHKREFSRKRLAETSEDQEWDMPEDIRLKFERMRQKALLNEDYKEFPQEYQELIREYLKLLNEKASE